MDGNVNILNWFEIPVADMVRAKNFYQTIFSITLAESTMMDYVMCMFPMENGNGRVSGALVQGPNYVPSATGARIYFNGNPDMATVLEKIEGAGGKITLPKTKISDEVGYMAFFTDSEGNSVALHSQN